MRKRQVMRIDSRHPVQVRPLRVVHSVICAALAPLYSPIQPDIQPGDVHPPLCAAPVSGPALSASARDRYPGDRMHNNGKNPKARKPLQSPPPGVRVAYILPSRACSGSPHDGAACALHPPLCAAPGARRKNPASAKMAEGLIRGGLCPLYRPRRNCIRPLCYGRLERQ